MTRAVSVRLDGEAERALRSLEASGLTQSEAIRAALIGEVRHRRRREELAAEVAARALRDVGATTTTERGRNASDWTTTP